MEEKFMSRLLALSSVAVLGLCVAGCANEKPAAAYELGLNGRPMSTANANNAAIGQMTQSPADPSGGSMSVVSGPGQVYKVQ
jgi:hypothetical protein